MNRYLPCQLNIHSYIAIIQRSEHFKKQTNNTTIYQQNHAGGGEEHTLPSVPYPPCHQELRSNFALQKNCKHLSFFFFFIKIHFRVYC